MMANWSRPLSTQTPDLKSHIPQALKLLFFGSSKLNLMTKMLTIW